MTNFVKTNSIQTCGNVGLNNKQKKIETTLSLKNAKTVLSVSACPYVEKTEIENKHVRVDGVVNFKVLYIDQENNNGLLDFKTGFSDTLEIASNGAKFVSLAQANLLEIESKSVGEEELQVLVLVDIKACVFGLDDSTYVEASESSGLCMLPSQTMLSTVASSLNPRFNYTVQVELGKNVARVVDTNAALSLIDVFVEKDKAVLTFQLDSSILFESSGDEIALKNFEHSQEFRQEFALQNAEGELGCVGVAELLFEQIKVVCENSGDEMNVQIDYPIQANCIVFEHKTVSTLADAYSETHDISITTASQGLLGLQGFYKFSDKIDSNLVIEKEYQSIEKIISHLSDNVVITKAFAETDQVILEGIAYTNIVYENFDQSTTQKGNTSIIAELPFSFRLNAKGAQTGDIVYASAIVGDIDARVKRASEIDVIATIRSQMFIMRNLTTTLVSELTVQGEKPQNENGLSIYVVEPGKAMWDVAKQLSVPMELIAAQNASMSLPSEKTEKVVVYRQKIMEVE